MKIAIAQINPTVGDLEKNYQNILSFIKKALALNADLVVFPELSLLGYPPKDLLLREDFLDEAALYHEKIAQNAALPVIFGSVIKREAFNLPYNAAIFCENGKSSVIAKKILLPNYNVFDEKRYFSAPTDKACQSLSFKGKKILISICEDAWNSLPTYQGLKYDFDPIKLGMNNNDLIINLSASPYTRNKPKAREQIFTHLAKTYECPVLYVGQVGANDQIIFDGNSMVIDKTGQVIKRAQPCREDLIIFDKEVGLKEDAHFNEEELLEEALVLGIKDYTQKCKSKGLIVGVSGGIDSAVCLALAVKALGPKNVRAIFLPTKFTHSQSFDDAKLLTSNLGLNLEVFPIEKNIDDLRLLLGKEFSKNSHLADIADQNLQSRLRGLIIMALANMSDYLMVATSNKSELSVGYSTIYGDMCGAFSPIGDLYKGEVYKLAHMMKEIPKSIILRPPTAELKPSQLDTDSLPDYAVLDQILFNFIDLEKSPAQIEKITGINMKLIKDVISMVYRSEYKRRQGPFCLMVSDKVFGDARRMPIAKHL